MLTRLKVNGFKNLVDVDVRFGPFTCIAGGNGVGKSNLFDVIRFLSALADRPLTEAALSVRDQGASITGSVRDLFHKVGNVYDTEMSFEAEIIIPATGEDELGQPITATHTHLRYTLTLIFGAGQFEQVNTLQIVREELASIPAHSDGVPSEAQKMWGEKIVYGDERRLFIDVQKSGDEFRAYYRRTDDTEQYFTIHVANNLPRTILSASNSDHPTVILARQELQSWKLFQFEPFALRTASKLSDPVKMGSDGSYLAANLFAIAAVREQKGEDALSRISQNLFHLLGGIYKTTIDVDVIRGIYEMLVIARDGTTVPMSSLSEGTLRLLAIVALNYDPYLRGVICVEEPENGIHPAKIPDMLKLLRDTAVDPDFPIDDFDNPLRQVIVNTHSPLIVSLVDQDQLIVAELREAIKSGIRFKRASFSYLSDTWREKADQAEGLKTNTTLLNRLIDYLRLLPPDKEDEQSEIAKRVANYPRAQFVLSGSEHE
jgi:predicted ATPase